MDNSVGGQRIKSEDVLYSSDDILSNSVAGKHGHFFTKIKQSHRRLNRQRSASQKDTRQKIIKKILIICGAIILMGAAVLAILWTFVWKSNDEVGGSIAGGSVTTDEDSAEEGTDAWTEELKLLNLEASGLLSKNTDESLSQAKELYDYELENYYPNISAKRVDVLLDYASVLLYSGYSSEAAAVLARLDIESYKKPEDLSEVDYVHQKLNYYALLRDIAADSAMEQEAKEYNQKVIDLTNEEDKLTGEKEGVEEREANE